MDWRLTVIKSAVVNRIPLGNQLRRVKRHLFGYEPDPINLQSTLSQLDRMQKVLADLASSVRDSTILEIGSGWFPTIPVKLCLDGARHVYMSDLSPHMDEVTFAATMKFLRATYADDERLSTIHSLNDLPISYLAPFNVSDIPDHSLNLVISRTVLEHIPGNDLCRLLEELHEKLAPGGLMVHLIDNSDHLEHSDKSLSKINFLTLSMRQHTLLCRLLRGGENRLRHHQYIPLFQSCGYQVMHAERDIHAGTLQRIQSLPLAPPYAEMPPDELAALTSLFVLAPAEGARSHH